MYWYSISIIQIYPDYPCISTNQPPETDEKNSPKTAIDISSLDYASANENVQFFGH